MKIPSPPTLMMIGGLSLAGLAGGLGAYAVTSSDAATPSRTVTINVGTGEQGPTGPAGPIGESGAAGPPGPIGPTGPSGATECPAGSTYGELVINHPGGHVSILTCILD